MIMTGSSLAARAQSIRHPLLPIYIGESHGSETLKEVMCPKSQTVSCTAGFKLRSACSIGVCSLGSALTLYLP